MDSIAPDWVWFWLPLLAIVVIRVLAARSSVAQTTQTCRDHHTIFFHALRSRFACVSMAPPIFIHVAMGGWSEDCFIFRVTLYYISLFSSCNDIYIKFIVVFSLVFPL